MKILIVEDDAGMRDSLREILESDGHQVLAAEDGVQGLVLAAQSPEFIFCDVHMPNLDGHGLLAEIRKLPGVCEVPFVFLTVRSEREELRAGMSLGADDYITKPYSAAEILGAIAARTKRQRGLREQIRRLAERHQREINAQWSHELLTPLNAVIGSLDLIEREAESITRAELKEMLALIRTGAERQERLARKLIAYFRLEQLANSPEGEARGACAAEVAAASGADRAARLLEREPDLTLTAAPGRVGVHERWLALAVGEVVENAAIYSRPGDAITIIGAIKDGRYHLSISDRGPGLTAEQCARAGAFVQFGRQKREQQGLGLGLAIARLVAHVGGGDLILKPGSSQGLEVEFRLPLAAGHS